MDPCCSIVSSLSACPGPHMDQVSTFLSVNILTEGILIRCNNSFDRYSFDISQHSMGGGKCHFPLYGLINWMNGRPAYGALCVSVWFWSYLQMTIFFINAIHFLWIKRLGVTIVVAMKKGFLQPGKYWHSIINLPFYQSQTLTYPKMEKSVYVFS